MVRAQITFMSETGSSLEPPGSCNIEGALTFKHEPCIPFARTMPSLLGLLPAEISNNIFQHLSQSLQECGVNSVVVNSITNVGIFNKTVMCSRSGGISVQFEPEHLMEEYYGLLYELLTLPRPFLSAGESADTVSLESHFTIKTDYMAVFETALRAASILHIRAPTYELMAAQKANANIITILFKQLGTLLTWLREVRKQTSATTTESTAAHTFIANARLFVVWMCIFEDVISVYTNFHPEQEKYGGQAESVACQLMREILSGGESYGIDSINEDDLRVSRLWNMGNIIGGRWDEKKTLNRIFQNV
jgi:hypothetical protein